jgi:thiol:disulfide interchange protein DsbA
MHLHRPNRRHSLSLMAAACIAPSARAQGGPVEGTHYVRLQQPVPVSAPAGKIEVVEFFWYGCPACNAFEPTLDAWARKLPPEMSFRRIPVGFGAVHESHQKLFYAIEQMGALETLHRRVFATIHQQRKMLGSDGDQIDFAAANGLDKAKFSEALKSFGVATKARQAKQLSAAYKIDGVPAMGVQGRYYTSPALAGGPDRALAVTEFLVQLARKGA